MKNVGKNVKLVDFPLDIRQRLLLDGGLDGDRKLIKDEDISDDLQTQIERTKRDIFRKKENETDQQYARRVDGSLQKNVGTSLKEVTSMFSKLPWFLRIFVDLLLNIGSFMG